MNGKPVHAGVERIPAGEAHRVIAILSDAFRDYPVMRFLLGDSDDDYERRLHRLVELFVMNRALRDDPLLICVRGADDLGAATVSFPGRPDDPPTTLGVLREEIWRELGETARAQYGLLTAVWQRLGITIPHIHLNMIGVCRSAQGQGLARRLLEHVHKISSNTPDSHGVTLTTEDAANVPFYEHMGYEVTGHAPVAPGLETWSMFRKI